MVLAYLMQPMAWLILLVVVLLLFGSRLPDAMRNLGSSVTSFKKGMKEGEGDDDEDKKRLDK
jgi:sec-independent protein translocase protein TatA